MTSTIACTAQQPNIPSAVKEKLAQQSTIPLQGIAKLVPTSWVPYVQLMRLDRPGMLGALMPLLMGLMYGISVENGPPAKPLSLLIEVFYWYIVGGLIRGAACTWNDMLDQEFDRKVPRTRNRPLARGAVTTRQAGVFTVAQVGVLAYVFSFLPPSCWPHCVTMGVLHFLYPLTKRVMDFTPVFLALPFSMMALIPAVAHGVEVQAWSTGALALVEFFWSIIYETIYAHQDAQHDVQAGIRSMAVRYLNSTKSIAAVLSVGMVAAMAAIGWLHRFSPLFFLVGCGGSTLSLATILTSVDLKVPSSIQYWFRIGFILVGSCKAGAFFSEYLLNLVSIEVAS